MCILISVPFLIKYPFQGTKVIAFIKMTESKSNSQNFTFRGNLLHEYHYCYPPYSKHTEERERHRNTAISQRPKVSTSAPSVLRPSLWQVEVAAA